MLFRWEAKTHRVAEQGAENVELYQIEELVCGREAWPTTTGSPVIELGQESLYIVYG